MTDSASPVTETTGAGLWSDVVGQSAAVAKLSSDLDSPVHAYLFVGPRGSGRSAAARAFAGALVGRGQSGEAAERALALARSNKHPDVIFVEPGGTKFLHSDDDPETGVAKLRREIYKSPMESATKVVVAKEFHTADQTAIGKLLKPIEEPPDSTVVILLAEEVPVEHVTVESRCTRVDFGPVPAETIRQHLVDTGTEPAAAELAADAAGGDVQRARLLVDDPQLADRYDTWYTAPTRLDGTGASVWRLVHDVTERIDAAQQPLDSQQAGELEAFDADSEHLGKRVGARKALVDRHKREVKLLRYDELVFGLTTLAEPYREHVQTGGDPAGIADSLAAIQSAAETFERNPIEDLLLESLFLKVTPLGG